MLCRFGISSKIREITLTKLLLTSNTVTETEFQIVNPVNILHKVLFLDLPGEGAGGEYTPVKIVGETGRTVCTYRYCEQVAIISVIVGTAEERNQCIVGRNQTRIKRTIL